MLELRAFETTDRDELIDWFPDAAALHDWAGPAATWPLDDDQLDRRLTDPAVFVWTAIRPPSNETFGHVELQRLGPREVRIDRLAIAPWRRGGGHGAELVRAVLDRARALDCVGVDLVVYADNLPAVRTYRAVGFTDAGPVSAEHPDVRRMAFTLS